jgi:hypothetical protein
MAVIYQEIADAEVTGYKRIVHIRVTTDALPGSPTSVPVTPERARTLGRLIALRDPRGGEATVAADPSDYERMLELLIHPQDWADVLRGADMFAGELAPGMRPGEPDSVYGIPVSR